MCQQLQLIEEGILPSPPKAVNPPSYDGGCTKREGKRKKRTVQHTTKSTKNKSSALQSGAASQLSSAVVIRVGPCWWC